MDSPDHGDTAACIDSAPAATPSVRGPPSWHAALELRCGRDQHGCTRLVQNLHQGPLRVQRLLYPEGPELAHALILHPPGGIAGGDVLEIDVTVDPGARLLCTTPGAAKWYHGERGSARQSQRLSVAADGQLEWLPQEAILFDGADTIQNTLIELDARASMFGWEIVQFGRGKPWQRGRWRQRLILLRDGRERWREIADVQAGDRLCTSALGLAGNAVAATAWAAAPSLAGRAESIVDELRVVAAAHALPCGISWLPAPTALLLIRVLGPTSEPVRALLETLWHALRPHWSGQSPQRPRIWDT